MSRKKKYVVDTNVFLSNHKCLGDFTRKNDVVIPFKVLDEIDNNKERQDSAGVNARAVIRKLDKLREGSEKSLSEGIKFSHDSGEVKIKEADTNKINLPASFSMNNPDNQIIATALTVMSENPSAEVILVTRDLNVRVKCGSLDIKCENYNDVQAIEESEKLFSGAKELRVDKKLIDKLYRDITYEIYPNELGGINLHPNEFVNLKSHDGQSSVMLRNIDENNTMHRVQPNNHRIWNIEPRNREQNYAIDLLQDEEVKLTTLVGKAGTGKTLVALASGLDQVMNSNTYKKLIVARPVEPVGRDIGYLPGSFEEKMMPWMKPIKDNLEEFTGGPAGLEMCMRNGKIEIEAISYIRGRSISDSFIIIDEAQNNSIHEIKTILTRVGENSKIVLTGDIKQIDSAYIDETSNGLTHAVENYKDQGIAGHCTLLKGERSELATIASEVM